MRMTIIAALALMAGCAPQRPDRTVAAFDTHNRLVSIQFEAAMTRYRKGMDELASRVPGIVALCNATIPRPRGNAAANVEQRAAVLHECTREKTEPEIRRLDALRDAELASIERTTNRFIADMDRNTAEQRALRAPGTAANPIYVAPAR